MLLVWFHNLKAASLYLSVLYFVWVRILTTFLMLPQIHKQNFLKSLWLIWRKYMNHKLKKSQIALLNFIQVHTTIMNIYYTTSTWFAFKLNVKNTQHATASTLSLMKWSFAYHHRGLVDYSTQTWCGSVAGELGGSIPGKEELKGLSTPSSYL